MPNEIVLYTMFFSKHHKKDAERLCEKIARKGVRVKFLSAETDLESEHIQIYVHSHPSLVSETAQQLEKLAKRIERITGIDDVIIQMMGHPGLQHRTKPTVELAAA